MVSQRMNRTADSSTDDETLDMDYDPKKTTKSRKPTRVPKCFSKNALMARENRIKKKMYITDLEQQVAALKTENKKLNAVVETQSEKLEAHKTEIQYLKSVIANSEGISKLIRNINVTTGMNATSSLQKYRTTSPTNTVSSTISEVVNSTVEEVPVYRTAHTWDPSIHPWKEEPYASGETAESESTYSYGSPDFDELKNDGLLLDLPLEINNDELLDMIDQTALNSPTPEIDPNLMHAGQPQQSENCNNVGVCLHVSNNRVSVEFCPMCNHQAQQNWG